jgi:Skp family chaperone for outer membrane proteins
MNKYSLSAAAAALSLAIPGAAFAQARTPAAAVVVIDNERIFAECTACRAASGQMQGMVTAANQRAQQLGQPIQTEAQSIQTAAQAAQAQPAATRAATENSLRQRAQALQGRQDAANQELQRLEQNIQSVRANVARQINERLTPIYAQVMNAHGANLALDVGATLAHAPALDVTNEVLTALNAALPSVSVTPLPAPPPGQQPQGR